MSHRIAAWPGLVHTAAQVSKRSEKASPEASSPPRSLLAPRLSVTIREKRHMTKPRIGVGGCYPKA